MRGHGGIVPAGIGQHPLQRAGGDGDRFRDVLRVAPLLALHQQPAQVVPAAFPPLLAPQMRRKFAMEIEKGFVHAFKLLQIHAPLPRVLRPQK